MYLVGSGSRRYLRGTAVNEVIGGRYYDCHRLPEIGYRKHTSFDVFSFLIKENILSLDFKLIEHCWSCKVLHLMIRCPVFS